MIVSYFSDFQPRIVMQEILTLGKTIMEVWNQKGVMYDKLLHFE